MVWTTNRIVALILGIVFTLAGIAGFFVSSSMTPGSLLGLDVDIVHNIVHFATGIIALIAVFAGKARLFNQAFGIVYLLIGLAALIPALYIGNMFLGMMHLNAADHVFHLVVGAVAAFTGFAARDTATMPTTPIPAA
ncbi:MAG: DUF4383 domain-containing protein [Ktedonobacteraceae bacterium]|nr:DUF4383 domain-containing protein [Ktedonobacteraceae bacterium]